VAEWLARTWVGGSGLQLGCDAGKIVVHNSYLNEMKWQVS